MQLGIQPCVIVDTSNPVTKQAAVSAGVNVVNNISSSTNALQTSAIQYVGNTLNNTFETVRTPTWFVTVQCTTVAATQVVAATAAKKHRILGGIIIIAGGTAAAGPQTVSILDVAADIGLDPTVWCSIAATPVTIVIPLDLKPNGKLTAAVNTAINVTLTAAMTAGSVSVTLWGDDE